MDAAILNYMNKQMAPMGGGVDQRRMTRAKDYLDTRRSIAGTRQIDANAERLELDNSQTRDTRAILEEYKGKLHTPAGMHAFMSVAPVKATALQKHFSEMNAADAEMEYARLESDIAQRLATEPDEKKRLKMVALLGKVEEVREMRQQNVDNKQEKIENRLAQDKHNLEVRKTNIANKPLEERAWEEAVLARTKAQALQDIPTRVQRIETGGPGSQSELGPVVDPVLRRGLRKDLISDNESIANVTVALDDLETNPGAVGVSGAIIDSKLLKYIGQIPGVGRPIQGGVSQALSGTSPSEIAAIRTRTRTLVASQLSTITGEESGRYTDREYNIAKEALRGLETSDSPETISGALRVVLELGVSSRIKNRRELGIEPKHDLSMVEGRYGLIAEMMERGLSDSDAIVFVKRLVKEEALK